MSTSNSKKTLDNPLVGPYPTPSMRSPLSPDMLKGANTLSKSRKGGSIHAGEEEGREEDRCEEEEEVVGSEWGVAVRLPSAVSLGAAAAAPPMNRS
jgi:hypothetical protein